MGQRQGLIKQETGGGMHCAGSSLGILCARVGGGDLACFSTIEGPVFVSVYTQEAVAWDGEDMFVFADVDPGEVGHLADVEICDIVE